jgi:hypothetical protein
MILGAETRRQQAGEMASDENFGAAIKIADEARQMAIDGLYSLVNESDDAIATARFYRGWDFGHDQLATAIVDTQKAREAIDAGRYAEAHTLARSSRDLARSVTTFSRSRDFRLRVRAMEALLSQSLQTGSNYFQTSDAKSLIAELKDLDQNFTPEKYDRYNEGLASVRSRVEQMIAATPEAMAEFLEVQRGQLDELQRLGAKGIARYELDLARRSFDQAEADFNGKRFTKSYEMALRGVRLSNAIATEIGRENFNENARETLDGLASAMFEFRQFLLQNPDTLKQMVSGYNSRGRMLAIAGGEDPARFADRTRTIYDKAVELKAPNAQEHLHRELIAACQEAMRAGQMFQKFLILDQFDVDARQDIIETGFNHIDNTRKKVAFLRERLLAKGERLPDKYQPPFEKMEAK